MSRTLGLLLIFCGALTVPAALAQQTDGTRVAESSIAPGDRVRITTFASAEPIVGRVLDVGPAEVGLVDEDGDPVATILRADIRRFERSLGRRSIEQRIVPGALGGAFLGFIIAAASTEEENCDPGDFICVDVPEKALGGFLGAGIGMLAGSLISLAIIPGESWEDASRPVLVAGSDARGGYLALTIPLGSGSAP